MNFWCSVIEDEGHASTMNEVELVIRVSGFQLILRSPATPMIYPKFGCIFQWRLSGVPILLFISLTLK